MDSFKLLKRRTTELFHSLPQSLPSLGSHVKTNTMKGTWEKVDVPPLPRTSHSADIVAGTLYIFGGEVEGRRVIDNDMHVVALPSSGAQADYYAIKAKPAKPRAAATEEPASTPTEAETAVAKDEEDEEEEEEEEDQFVDSEETPDDRHLSDVSLTTPSPAPNKGKSPATLASSLPDVPAPRVGHATAVIGHRIFLFGGRARGSTPADSPALNEGGRVWVFDTRTHLWSFLDPTPAATTVNTTPTVPPPRSGHAAVATAKPDTFSHPHPPPQHHSGNTTEAWRDWALGDTTTQGTPQHPVVGVLAERATDADADGYGTLIIHGGYLSSGSNSTEYEVGADTWAFDIRSRTWQRLPDAPSAGAGVGLAMGRGRVYRFASAAQSGEGDGEGEVVERGVAEGELDFLDLGLDVFDDQVSRGEAVVCARGGWQSLLQGREDVGYKEVDAAVRPSLVAEGREWPGKRKGAGLQVVTVGGGREYLVLMFGERDGSGPGQGKYWDDVWAFQVPAEGMSLASVADTAFSVVGRKSGEGRWARVEMSPFDDEDDASADGPGARGWVASATMGDLEENGIVVWGGLGEGDRRLGDGWILRLG